LPTYERRRWNGPVIHFFVTYKSKGDSMQRVITRGLSLSLLTMVSLFGAGTSHTSAQTNTVNQYAAKFVCGKTDGDLAAP